jgi:hypothetical protein
MVRQLMLVAGAIGVAAALAVAILEVAAACT